MMLGPLAVALAAVGAVCLLATSVLVAEHGRIAQPHGALGLALLRPAAPVPARDAGRVLLFVGGLQRSGTTTLATTIDALDGASAQSFDWLKRSLSANASEDRFAAICRWRGVGRSYLRDVIRSGGLEGKFAQDVYPYVYALRDWGRGGNRGLRRLALDADSDLATAENAAKLWDEWKDFWNASAAVLVEKTPENVVRSTFLQALYPANARFVFVLRHPLAWALAVDKWLKNKWNAKHTRYLVDAEDRAMDRRLDMWRRVWTKAREDLASLDHAAVVHAEAAALDGASPALARVLGGAAPDLAPFRGLARSNLQYVACWLDGGVLDRRKTCVAGASAHREAAVPRAAADLAKWRSKHAPALASFGYATPDFRAALCGGPACAAPAPGVALTRADVGLDLAGIRDEALLRALRS